MYIRAVELNDTVEFVEFLYCQDMRHMIIAAIRLLGGVLN